MKGYIAYNLSKASASAIAAAFPFKFNKHVCHHVTLQFGVNDSEPLPEVSRVFAVGYACDDKIECLVVEVDGQTTRPDGSFYHITLSHSDKAKPVDSNKLKNHVEISRFEIFGNVVFNKF